MTTKEAQEFEIMLLGRGYKKWTRGLHGQEDYDVSKMFRDNDGEDIYLLIFRFWDWTKFEPCAFSSENAMSVDMVVLPVFDGRADLELSSLDDDVQLDVERMEKLAEDYYQFIIERLK